MFSPGSDGRYSSADAELWRPCRPDIARGNRGEVGSLALAGGKGVLLDQGDQVVGRVLDGGNVCLGKRLIRG
jgi:hypothetical protein